MKIFQLAIATLTIIGFGSVAADTVNPANVTTFESGAPARASEVNSTLQALIAAIDDNATRIAAIETEQSRLVPASVEGSTYCMYEMANGVGAGDPDPVSGDGNWMGAFAGAGITQVSFDVSQATLTKKLDMFYDAVAPSNRLMDSSDPLDSEMATWTQLGNTVTLNFGGGDLVNFFVTPDSNVMIYLESEVDRSSDDSGDWFDVALLVGIRAATCN